MAVACGCRGLLCPRTEGEGWDLGVRLPPPPGASERRSVRACSDSIVWQLPPSTLPSLPPRMQSRGALNLKTSLNTPHAPPPALLSFSELSLGQSPLSPSLLLPPLCASKSRGMCWLNSVVRLLFIGPAGFATPPLIHTHTFIHTLPDSNTLPSTGRLQHRCQRRPC